MRKYTWSKHFYSVKYTRYLYNKVILTKFQQIKIAMRKVGGSRDKTGIVQQLCQIDHVYCQLNT